MLVLKIIGLIIAIITVYMLVVRVNTYTIKKYRYQFFNSSNFTASAIGYGMIFFGYRWYVTALAKNGDTLNGMLLLLIGSTVILAVVYNNVKKTSTAEGLGLSLLQIPIYSAFALILIAVLVLLAAAAERNNNCDYSYDDNRW